MKRKVTYIFGKKVLDWLNMNVGSKHVLILKTIIRHRQIKRNSEREWEEKRDLYEKKKIHYILDQVNLEIISEDRKEILSNSER